MQKLSSDHEEILRDLVQSEAWKAVLSYCDVVIHNHAEAVVKYDLNGGSRGLVILKARLDGARSLAAALHSVKKQLKIKDE